MEAFIESAASQPDGPLTGGAFDRWSDRLRDVEDMVDDPAWRAEAARIRERARGVRRAMRRGGKGPRWDLIRTGVLGPLQELRDRIGGELARRDAKGRLVPIDRDPVPPEYVDPVRRYYEELGRGR